VLECSSEGEEMEEKKARKLELCQRVGMSKRKLLWIK